MRAEVADRSRRIASFAIFHRLKAIVDLWEREERGKARVAVGAFTGLVVLGVATARVALWQPAYWGEVLLLGFVVWVGTVLLLMRKHLGRGD